MDIFINNILEWLPTMDLEEGEIINLERVLWIPQDYSGAFVINLIDPKAWPVFREKELIQNAFSVGTVQKTTIDYVKVRILSDEEIPEKHKILRDKRWSVISGIVNKEPEIFYSSNRGQMIREVMEEFGCSKPYVYESLRQYWRFGMTINALLPDLDRCGGAGKTRQVLTAKRGRPKKILVVAPDYVGVNIDEVTKKKLLLGAKLFYFNNEPWLKYGNKPKGSGNKPTWEFAYSCTMARFFNRGYTIEDGVEIPLLADPSEIPTCEQFKYWVKKETDVVTGKKARYGPRAFELRPRQSLGKSIAHVVGPGHIWQIDSTIGDIYLRSRYFRWRIIGRPVIYIIVDVFSTLIVGLYVGLEGPDWMGAAMALENAHSDKVSFCSKYGIDILPEQWPSQHLPQNLIVDRGEMMSQHSRNLIRHLGVNVLPLPPYRPDWKGMVEAYFRLINDGLIKWQPGAVYDKERGDRDYRLDATLDMYEFTQLMILLVLQYNNDRLLEQYPLNRDMIKDGVRPYASEIWQWGVPSRPGYLKQYSEDFVKFNLMPSSIATVTFKGIEFNGMTYGSEKALVENWFVRARDKSWKVPVSYDPRLVNNIYC